MIERTQAMKRNTLFFLSFSFAYFTCASTPTKSTVTPKTVKITAPDESLSKSNETIAANDSNKTYIAIGNMAVNNLESTSSASIRASMKSIALKKLEAISWITTNAPNKTLNKSQRATKNNQDFIFSANVTKLDWQKYPFIECSVSVLLATYPEKNILGFVNQNLELTLTRQNQVQAPTKADFHSAGKTCVDALFEYVVSKKVIPAFKEKRKP